MREIEKHYCGYVILGLPDKPFRFLADFLVRKGVRPTVYADRASVPAKLLGLAAFLPDDILRYDSIGVESLERLTVCGHFKRFTLICANSKFSEFIERNRERLEKSFIIQTEIQNET